MQRYIADSSSALLGLQPEDWLDMAGPVNIPGLLGVMNVWTLLIPASLFFFGAGMLFPLATSGAMEPFPFLAGTAGALVGGLQNIGSGALAWLSAMMPQTGQSSLGLLMTLMGLLILLCWLPLASRVPHHEQPV
jgi:DHA1 family 2-module integral membrane pump EmrD-like MFS transporter